MLTETLQRQHHTVRVATVVPQLLVAGTVEKTVGLVTQAIDQVEQLDQQLVGQRMLRLSHSKMPATRVARKPNSCPRCQPPGAANSFEATMTTFKFSDVGGMRLTLILFSLISLPLVVFADMKPQGIGVLTAYIVPSLVVLFFFVLMLDALMNRVFMIEQPSEVQAVKRMRMWLDLGVGAALLVVWGSYFRTLLEV